ncbi:unnamed protein product, partial [marine sediment metagenome]
ITKVKKSQIVIYILLDGTDRKVEIEVSGNDEPQITAFLAEIGDRTRKQLIHNKIHFNAFGIVFISFFCQFFRSS